MKPKLLVVELWGVGDLAIATPFLCAAAEHFEITLLAKPHAAGLQSRFWPEVRVIPFVAPWTVFHAKYHFWHWPWRAMFSLRRTLRAENFETGVSARWDPRDHWLLNFLGAKKRLGFPRLGSSIFLTDPLVNPGLAAHRYEFWRVAGKCLDVDLPARGQIALPSHSARKLVLVHSGAGQPVRVWPLENYRNMVWRLRECGYPVQVICDANQVAWWLQAGESQVVAPPNLTALIAWLDQAGVFIGNDSGPGHLAAISGVPTFTFFGPSLPERFAPLHPHSEWMEDSSCAYKPCKDYCHFSSPRCLENIKADAAWPRIQAFVQSRLNGPL